MIEKTTDLVDVGALAVLDIRIGTIRRAEPFHGARRPAIKLWIWFGDCIGEKRSSAQITQIYSPETLIGLQVVAIINFPPKQIGSFYSEVLVLGAADAQGRVVLLRPERTVPDGTHIF